MSFLKNTFFSSQSKQALKLNGADDICFYTVIDVELHWHERDLVIVGPISKEESGVGGRAEYEVSFALFNIYS